jgi:hypothetical protein
MSARMNGTMYHGDLIAPATLGRGGFIVRGYHNSVETFASEEAARLWIDAELAAERIRAAGLEPDEILAQLLDGEES